MGHGDRHDAQVGGDDVAQAVPEHHLPLVQPLGLGQQNVLRANLLQQLVADHVGVVPQVVEHRHRQRQDQVQDAVANVTRVAHRIRAAAGQPAQVHREHQNQHQRQPELRDAADHRAHPAQDAVGPAVLVPGAEHAHAQRQREDQHKGHTAQNQRVHRAPADHLQHVRLVLVGDAEVAAQRALQPAHVLHVDGLVQAQLFLGPGALLRLHLFHPVAVVGDERVAGGEAGDVEGHDGEQQHAEQEDQQLLPVVEPGILAHHAPPPL